MNSRGATVLAGVVFVVSVIAFVVLELNGADTDGLMLLAGPAVGALIVSGQVAGQSRTLAKIEKQTNGVLDARIEQGTARALERAGVTVAGPTDPPPIPPTD